MLSRGWVALMATVAAVAIGAGCGDSEGGGEVAGTTSAAGERGGQAAGGEDGGDGGAQGPGAADGDVSGPGVPGVNGDGDADDDGRRVRTLPNGTVIRTPPKPKRTVSEPLNRCRQRELQTQQGDGTITVTVPPAPGLSARRDGEAVVVTYETGAPPTECRPDFVSVFVDGNDDPLPPISRDLPVTELGRHSVRVEVPEFINPDVARATAGTDDGRLSATTKILIER